MPTPLSLTIDDVLFSFAPSGMRLARGRPHRDELGTGETALNKRQGGGGYTFWWGVRGSAEGIFAALVAARAGTEPHNIKWPRPDGVIEDRDIWWDEDPDYEVLPDGPYYGRISVTFYERPAG